MTILQWNMNGFYSHLAELQYMISKINPQYICSSRFKRNQLGKLRNYNVYQINRPNTNIASGGVAIFASNPTDQLYLTTDLKAVAIRTFLPNTNKITIYCLYLLPR